MTFCVKKLDDILCKKSDDSSPADDTLLLLAAAADDQPQGEEKAGGHDSHLLRKKCRFNVGDVSFNRMKLLATSMFVT